MFPTSAVRIALVALVALAATGCGSSHALHEVAVEGEPIAIAAAIPPAPRVQSGHPAEAGIDLYDPIGSAVRVGTAIHKRKQARRAQARLDSVVAEVDVADRIARQVLATTAQRLRFEPAPQLDDAAYVLDLRIFDYALVADSFEGDTYFVLEGEILFLDGATGRQYWHAHLREREILDGSFFGMPAALGNVITGRALANLTPEEMATGLNRLADYTAQRIVNRFERDYRDSRRAYDKAHRGR
ncbi:MAG: hypothetical protein Rubg2KO_26080 [Rubricoccaceae bacterium]